MSDRVELRDFEAVELFRAALVRFIEIANGAMTSAEVEITRTMNWLEGEQLPHWKLLLRQTAEDLERAKTAYREKKNYKDSSGARQSAIDELKILRKVEAKRAEVEKRDKATRRNLRQLQREATMYHGSAHHLRGVVNGKLSVAAQELRGVVEQLERYVQVAPDVMPPEPPGGGMARPSSEPAMEALEAGGQRAETAPDSASASQGATATGRGKADEALMLMLRSRTPAADVRRVALRADSLPPVPEVPVDATATLRRHLKGSVAGRYDLVTTSLCSEDDGRELYLHRTAAAFGGDSGWHIGASGPQAEAGACVTITAGRLIARRPEMEHILALPEGSLLLATNGVIVLALDGEGRVLWRGSTQAGDD